MKTLRNDELKNYLIEAENSFYADGRSYFAEGDEFGAEGDEFGAEGEFGADGEEYHAQGDLIQAIASPAQYLMRQQPLALGLTPQNQTPYQILINNTGSAPQDVVLFRSYFPFTIPAAISISLQNSIQGLSNTAAPGTASETYEWLQEVIKTNPFVTVLIRLESQDQTNLGKIIRYSYNEPSANKTEDIQPIKSVNQFQSNIVEVPRSVSISGYSALTFNVEGNSSLLISFYLATRVNVTNLAFGASPAVAPIAQPGVNKPVKPFRPRRLF